MKTIIFLFCLTCSLPANSQKDSTAYQRFFARLYVTYKDFSKPPLKNYFETLTNTARFNFTTYNPLFRKALKEMPLNKNEEEEMAVKKLLDRSFTDLKTSLWISNESIYEKNKDLFDIYNDYMCPCITKQVKREARMDVMLKAVQSCVAGLTIDTAFLNKLKDNAGGKTMNELFNLQQYISLFAYQNCDIVNYKFNETIWYEPVSTTYYMDLEEAKSQQGINAIKYFKAKQFDSLAIIFPGYKKFLPEFNKVLSVLKQTGIEMRANYMGHMDSGQEIVIRFFKNEAGNTTVTGTAVLKTPTDAFNSKIISLMYQVYKVPEEEERLMEIKEEVQISAEKKNR